MICHKSKQNIAKTFFQLFLLLLFASCKQEIENIYEVVEIEQVLNAGLPVVKINTPNSNPITSKEEWMSGASFALSNASNPEWNFENLTTNIRGRGNSTWGQPKKPYALKLDKRRKSLAFRSTSVGC